MRTPFISFTSETKTTDGGDGEVVYRSWGVAVGWEREVTHNDD